MKVISRFFNDVFLIELDVFSDERGYFLEFFQQKKLEQCGLPPD
ncbi:MAG: dTDP-4-dehydrorhamnose 3,5-epimerase family protein [Bdellovibrionaceae bacterium]|nr:dTDP-4-dehydrorhamnose 3,5-epimerase family protein [Pseudobdellovibrionaceae bacterium]MDW8191150.1 dTDP-4-dehydrorhamnose 3,5-epimerase family protein [Pseudobdellovibrionaceae bacterium]